MPSSLIMSLQAKNVLIGTLGAPWIVFRGDLDALLKLNLNYGDLIFLVGCLFLGLYSPLVKRLYAGEPMEVMTFWIILMGSGWLFILSINGLSILIGIEPFEWVTLPGICVVLMAMFLIQKEQPSPLFTKV